MCISEAVVDVVEHINFLKYIWPDRFQVSQPLFSGQSLQIVSIKRQAAMSSHLVSTVLPLGVSC